MFGDISCIHRSFDEKRSSHVCLYVSKSQQRGDMMASSEGCKPWLGRGGGEFSLVTYLSREDEERGSLFWN